MDRLTAEYPPELASALATIIKAFTSCSGQKCSLGAWRSLLPTKLTHLTHRVEDGGGGLPSSALCAAPLSISPWPSLRKKWFHRLCESRDCLKIVAHLHSGDAAPPLTERELQHIYQIYWMLFRSQTSGTHPTRLQRVNLFALGSSSGPVLA